MSSKAIIYFTMMFISLHFFIFLGLFLGLITYRYFCTLTHFPAANVIKPLDSIYIYLGRYKTSFYVGIKHRFCQVCLFKISKIKGKLIISSIRYIFQSINRRICLGTELIFKTRHLKTVQLNNTSINRHFHFWFDFEDILN